MKRSLKRALSAVLAASVMISASSFAGLDISAPLYENTYAAGTVSITDAQGWLESAWVEWKPVAGASSYKVFYKGSSGSYTQIDDMLLRKYGTYWRADILGIEKGSYTIKVSAIDASGAELASAEQEVDVEAQDRSGFAFHKSKVTTPGAYDENGKLKPNAQVIYLTNDNFNTKEVMLYGKNNQLVTAVGFDDIIKQLAYAYNPPTAIRIIGRIGAEAYSGMAMTEDCVQMKGLESGSNKNDYTCEVTIEGVGNDAALSQGTSFYKAAYCEMRNLAVGGFGDDGVSLKSCKYMWIHNLDLFYGNAGSDADQAKGDGSIDLKDDSQYVNVDYVHFWDSGKCSLCGMKSESGPNYITYHHNWFDHSDSRHPRIRSMSVHIYNNYFDSNAKYGVGVTYGGSAFVESNVFKDCKHPMLIAMQGTDGESGGKGTFSGENGGVIKACNNQMSGSTQATKYYSSSNTQEFDAYEVKSRDEEVPSSVKAKQGGTSYDNASLAIDNVNATPEDVDTVVTTVKKYAGRTNRGDFTYDWSGNGAENYNVDNTLKSKVLDYVETTPYLSVGPNENGAFTEPSSEPPSQGSTSKPVDPDPEISTDPEEETETSTVDPAGAASMGTYELGSSAKDGDFNVVKKDIYGNIDFSGVRSVETVGIKIRAGNTIPFTLSSSTIVEITCTTPSTPVIFEGGGARFTCTDTGKYTVPAGAYKIYGSKSGDNSTITRLVLTQDSSSTVTPEPPVEETTAEVVTAPEGYKTIDAGLTLNKSNYAQYTANNGGYFEPNDSAKVYAHDKNDAIRIRNGGTLTFTVAANATITITAGHASSSTSGTRRLMLKQGSGTLGTLAYEMGENNTRTIASKLAAGTYVLTADNDININSVVFSFDSAPAFTKGDADNSGNVDDNDPKTILMYVVGLINSVNNPEAADVDGDKTVTSRDSFLIQEYIKNGKW